MQIKILIVEDEALIAMHLKSILEDLDYFVTHVNSFETAVKYLDLETPQLVLLDINLNKAKDGVDLGHYLLAKGNVPYVYLTSYADKITIDRVNETRPNGYIIKPFKPIDLSTTISVVLNTYKHKNIDVYNDKTTPLEIIPYQLKAVVRYINDNVDKKLEVDELTNLTEWTRHHFIKLFTKYLNKSPYQYVLQRKIEKAKSLLIDNDMTANQIAFELGFKSYSNFCHAFKKNYNDTPLAYRNKYQK